MQLSGDLAEPRAAFWGMDDGMPPRHARQGVLSPGPLGMKWSEGWLVRRGAQSRLGCLGDWPPLQRPPKELSVMGLSCTLRQLWFFPPQSAEQPPTPPGKGTRPALWGSQAETRGEGWRGACSHSPASGPWRAGGGAAPVPESCPGASGLNLPGTSPLYSPARQFLLPNTLFLGRAGQP